MNRPRLIWLILPALLFFVVLIVLVVRLPKPQSVATTVPASVPTPTPASPASPAQTQVHLLLDRISSFKVSDPQLATPNFDRKISLPQE